MATTWRIGDLLDERYLIWNILGGPERSGMGVVYVVYDREQPGVYAAKTFQDEYFSTNPRAAEMFSREALTWINLDVHQNVTEARSVMHIEGKPYLFLEYVGGGDLYGWMKSRAWVGRARNDSELPQALRLAVEFCDGMSHALSKGVKAHRDIKPQNCLLTEAGTLKVTDFGLAKIFDDAGHAPAEAEPHGPRNLNPALSRTGMGRGTPLYMAPEQFEDAKHVDARADIYSFGVMLYQMLAGRLPWGARREPGEDTSELHRRARLRPRPLPPATDEGLREIVERCLEHDPALRFGDFTELRGELAAVLERITGRPAPQPVVGDALRAFQWNNKGANLSELGRHEGALACFDRALELDPESKDAWVNKGAVLRKLERWAEAVNCYDRALALDPDSNLAWVNKGLALQRLGQHAESLEFFEQALRLNPRTEGAWYSKGMALSHLGRHDEALKCYDEALKIKRRYERTWVAKGSTLEALGRDDEALKCYDGALELDDRSRAAWEAKGDLLSRLQRFEEAAGCYAAALRVEPHDERLWVMEGVALCELGRWDEAAERFDQALALDPDNADTWYDKGFALGSAGRLEESVECYRKALELNPKDVRALYNMGVALLQLDRPEEGIDCLFDGQQLGDERAASALESSAAAICT